MLQQTRMETVIPYFNRWVQSFPTIGDLAAANDDFVMKHWEGLGYYSRCSNLLKSARTIVAEHNSEIPRDFESLTALPGIGSYTAGAVLSIAYDLPYPSLDGNLKRVLSRLNCFTEAVDTKEASELFSKSCLRLYRHASPRIINQALMDLGAGICSSASAKCENCPLTSQCLAFKTKLTDSIPLVVKKSKPTELINTYYVYVHGRKVALKKISKPHWWAGNYTFPYFFEDHPKGPEVLFIKKPVADEDQMELMIFSHGVTRYKIQASVKIIHLSDTDRINIPGAEWLDTKRLDEVVMPSPCVKIKNKLISAGIIS